MWVNREQYEKEQKLLRIIDLAFPMMVENAKRLVDCDYPTEKAVIILRNELKGGPDGNVNNNTIGQNRSKT